MTLIKIHISGESPVWGEWKSHTTLECSGLPVSSTEAEGEEVVDSIGAMLLSGEKGMEIIVDL